MTKRNKDEPRQPTATNVDFPVFVPDENGEVSIEVGRARMRYGTMVIEFKDSGPSVAIQNMIERGVVLGFSFVMLQPDVVNTMYQDVVANEEALARANEKAIQAGILRLTEDGKLESVNPNQTVEEVQHFFLNMDQLRLPEAQADNNNEENN